MSSRRRKYTRRALIAAGFVAGGGIAVGTCGPVFEPARKLTRFRILNGSNPRFYNLGFTDDRPFRVTATDNGFVPGDPGELPRLQLGPGDQADMAAEPARACWD